MKLRGRRGWEHTWSWWGLSKIKRKNLDPETLAFYFIFDLNFFDSLHPMDDCIDLVDLLDSLHPMDNCTNWNGERGSFVYWQFLLEEMENSVVGRRVLEGLMIWWSLMQLNETYMMFRKPLKGFKTFSLIQIEKNWFIFFIEVFQEFFLNWWKILFFKAFHPIWMRTIRFWTRRCK